MLREFPKSYNPKDAENKWYNIWAEDNLYQANNNSSKKGYSILLPPPNVTGILHFGHILNMTIQDLFIRRNRMLGMEVCWFPGIDHAGIATQTRVEKELKNEGLTRYDLGREQFVERVLEWKNKYGGIIFKQMEQLGVSIDWSRTIFTMDKEASDTVIGTFIKLFDDGLIYRGKRIINWSPLSQTALSDEEVEFREVNEKLYTLKYQIDGSSEYICCATARPETIYGDIAVAVNPNDERYKHLIGKYVIAPLVHRKIIVVGDDYADPAFGTGCVKITPAHDPNDFLVGERHNLEVINTINPDGSLNELAGEFNGLDRFEARKRIVEKLKENNLIEKVEDYTHNVGFSQRGGEPVEPYLSDQWFVKMKPLAELALTPVLEGEIKFYPNHWVKTYEHWMNNIRDWCISRQLWWGHRIPVYYTPDGRLTAAKNEKQARVKLNISDDIPLKQDEDVLDTWFSSWLWPMTTMKWDIDSNEYSADMKKFYPTDLLVTAPDIIFFWVARMIMATKYHHNIIPFKDVYFTSLIRDGKGRKLSKSLGNSPDPLNIIDKYGADAVRFTMLYLSPLGQDVRMDVDVDAQDIPSVEIGRNFCNKIWNAARFIMMKFDQFNQFSESRELLSNNELSISDKWLLSRLNSTIEQIDSSLIEYKINDYSKIVYDFIWRDFCDWYVEILKIQSNDQDNHLYNKKLINSTIDIFETILKIIHPIMPFISEEIWHLISANNDNKSISTQSFPLPNNSLVSEDIENKFLLVQNLVEEVRKLKNTNNIAPSNKLPLYISLKDETYKQTLVQFANIISILSKTANVVIEINAIKPDNSISSVYRDIELHLISENKVDIEQLKDKLKNDISRVEGLIKSTESKLNNEKFVSNAKPDIIQKEKEKHESLISQLELLKNNLSKL
ncbi:MAG TPA: valine--tRNA ligase [Candidatus Kapabacteria bacterium]|nr:valine--tRNA ligase [Candidatus Kapabacteria bacterium]